jgi:hypothetical protein
MKVSFLDFFKNKDVQTKLCVALLISFTLFIFGSANLYFTNVSEFSFLFSMIWYYFVALALIVLVVIFVFLVKIDNKYSEKITVLFFALGLLLWIQGNIIVWNYGLLDGHTIPWADYFWNGIVDAIVWITILAIFFIKSDFIYKHIRIVCILLILVQFVGLMATVSTAPSEPTWKCFSHDSEKLYEFSSDTNVIIIILDTYQSDVFQEIIDENEKYKDMFDGFTYYRNSLSGFPMTEASITNILSGKYYDNSVPIQDFIKNTTLDNSLPVVLKQNGFRTSISAYDFNAIYPTYDVFDDISSEPVGNAGIVQNTNLDDASFLTELTLFRHIPQPLKMMLFSKPLVPGKIDPDLIMSERFKTQVTVGSSTPTFKIFHLSGAHEPFIINENLESQKLPFNRSGYKSTAKAALSITNALLTSLKKQGTYNNSLIFIVGDHGNHQGYTGLNNTLNKTMIDSIIVSEAIIPEAIPLILVKPINSTGPLSISDAPVALADIPKTIAESQELANDYPGESLFDNNISRERIRLFYHYDGSNDIWNNQSVLAVNGYLPALKEYQINGFSWESGSWNPTYRTLTSRGVQYNLPPIYHSGTTIHFGLGGEVEPYLGIGWGGPENGFMWTSETRSGIIFQMNKPQSDLLLNLQFSPFLVDNKLDHQRLNIWINGHLIKNYTVSTPGPQTIAVVLNRTLLNENIQTVVFELPDATSPYEIGSSPDLRKLGIAVQSFSLTEKNESLGS